MPSRRSNKGAPPRKNRLVYVYRADVRYSHSEFDDKKVIPHIACPPAKVDAFLDQIAATSSLNEKQKTRLTTHLEALVKSCNDRQNRFTTKSLLVSDMHRRYFAKVNFIRLAMSLGIDSSLDRDTLHDVIAPGYFETRDGRRMLLVLTITNARRTIRCIMDNLQQSEPDVPKPVTFSESAITMFCFIVDRMTYELFREAMIKRADFSSVRLDPYALAMIGYEDDTRRVNGGAKDIPGRNTFPLSNPINMNNCWGNVSRHQRNTEAAQMRKAAGHDHMPYDREQFKRLRLLYNIASVNCLERALWTVNNMIYLRMFKILRQAVMSRIQYGQRRDHGMRLTPLKE